MDFRRKICKFVSIIENLITSGIVQKNVYNDGITISIQDPQTLDTVRQRYIAALRDVKVRTFNVLDA